MDPPVDIIVVGNDLSALVAAYRAAKAGQRVQVVLESKSTFGKGRHEGFGADFVTIHKEEEEYNVALDYDIFAGMGTKSDRKGPFAEFVQELQPDRLWRDESIVIAGNKISAADSKLMSAISEHVWGRSKSELSSAYFGKCLTELDMGIECASRDQMRRLLDNLWTVLRKEYNIDFIRGEVVAIDQSEGCCLVFIIQSEAKKFPSPQQRRSRAVIFTDDPSRWCQVTFTSPPLSFIQQRAFRLLECGVFLRVVVGFAKPFWGAEGFVHLISRPDSNFTSCETCSVVAVSKPQKPVSNAYFGLSFLISGGKACRLLDSDDGSLDARLEQLVMVELHCLAIDSNENSPLYGHQNEIEESRLFIINNRESAHVRCGSPVCVSQNLEDLLGSYSSVDESGWASMLKPCKNVYFSMGLLNPKSSFPSYTFDRCYDSLIESSTWAVERAVEALTAVDPNQGAAHPAESRRNGSKGWTVRDYAFATLIFSLLTFSGIFIAVSLYALANSYYVQYPNGYFGQTVNFISQCGRANALDRKS
jgi:hypothetical protein